MNRLVLFLFLLFLSLSAFQQRERSPEELAIIEKAIEERVASFVLKRRRECRAKLLDRANAIVDSTLIANAKLAALDSFARPPKPLKPFQPEVKEIGVATPIRPLLNVDSLLRDSLMTDSLLLDSLRTDSLRLDSLRLDSLGLSPLENDN
ncbi:MAG: hypothetical protein AAFP19_08370 [Bacteroidota bacterium]